MRQHSTKERPAISHGNAFSSHDCSEKKQGNETTGKERKGKKRKNGGFPPNERLDNFRTVAGMEKRKEH